MSPIVMVNSTRLQHLNRLCTEVFANTDTDLNGNRAGYLLVVNDKVWVALVVVEDDIDLRVHPVVNTGVIKVTRGIARVDGRRSPHGGISYSIPAYTKKAKRTLLMQLRS